ncbi:MAG: FAD-linked oxidase C-terminal domain-containing protein, partial [Casimicrobiaceae bacterium]
KMRAIAEEASAMVRVYKGAFSGEHGDGLVRSEWVAWQFGPRLTHAFQQIKDAFDPTGLMNPGKIVRASRMDDTSLFRYPPGYRALPIATALDWSAWDVNADPAADTQTAPGSGGDPAQGFGKAVDMCNNNGHCRKFDAGTMCPSYRVTRDETHLTRGRANTLRLALSGQLGADLASEPVRAALDLCVGCKGCRRECPTGVDMARMKVEFQHHWQRRHGLALRERLFATLPRWAPLASRLAWLFNLRDRLPGAAWIGERLLGIAAARTLPRWRRDTFLRAAAASKSVQRTGTIADTSTAQSTQAQAVANAANTSPPAYVVLLADTFSNYFEPENAHAAMAVLRAAGYTVEVAHAARGDSSQASQRPLCCGRTYLAAGLIDLAKAEARRTLAALLPHVKRGAAIVALEPSCLYTLRDEYLVMGLGEDARHVAERACMIEDFIAAEHRAGRLHLPLHPLPQKRALLHGHCHQKAFDAMGAVQQVLSLVPGLCVELVESSCCGMAGSFGYEARHHAISMQMAELSLLPALRDARDDTLLVADGTSCRHQIADGLALDGQRGSRRHAVHVIRVLQQALLAGPRGAPAGQPTT